MDWIIKPNQWYDQVEEPYRLLGMIGMVLFANIIEWIVGFKNLALLIICFAGIYRILYHIIMTSRKLTQADKKSVS